MANNEGESEIAHQMWIINLEMREEGEKNPNNPSSQRTHLGTDIH